MQSGNILRGKYAMDRLLGQGACGAVWMAHDTAEPVRKYAVKELVNNLADSAGRNEAIDLFFKEAGILSNLRHPGLPCIFDFFSEGQSYFLVMEFVPGTSLKKVLDQSGQPVLEVIAAGWALQILDVLEYLHRQLPAPVIFRDLKPSNIMLLPSGRIELVDFGIARIFDPAKKTDTVCLGTPGYAAPEQYPGSGRQSDPRSDLYALGVILHQAVTLEDPESHPFQFAPVNTLNPAVSPEMTALIEKATRTAPAARFQYADEFREALNSALNPAPRRPAPKRPAPAPGTPAGAPSRMQGLMRGLIWLFYINGWLPANLQNSCRFIPDSGRLLTLVWWLSFFGWLETLLYFLTTADLIPGTPGLFLGLSLLIALLSRACLLRMGLSPGAATPAIILGLVLIAGSSFGKIKTALPDNYSLYSIHPTGSSNPSIALNTSQTKLYENYNLGRNSYIHDVWRYSSRDHLIIQIPTSDFRIEAIYLLPDTRFMTRKGLRVGDAAKKALKLYGGPEAQKRFKDVTRWFFGKAKTAVDIRDNKVQLIMLARDFNLIRDDYSEFILEEP